MHHNTIRLALGWIAFVVVAVAPIGCKSKDSSQDAPKAKEFTPEEFKNVKAGMSEAEVKDILGEPKQTMEAMGITRKFWQVGDKYYSVSFKEGKVGEPMGPSGKEDNEMMVAFMIAAKQMEQEKKNKEPKTP